jgi:hypothetical protein
MGFRNVAWSNSNPCNHVRQHCFWGCAHVLESKTDYALKICRVYVALRFVPLRLNVVSLNQSERQHVRGVLNAQGCSSMMISVLWWLDNLMWPFIRQRWNYAPFRFAPRVCVYPKILWMLAWDRGKKVFHNTIDSTSASKNTFFWRCLAIMVSNSGKAGSLTNIRCSILVSINRERMWNDVVAKKKIFSARGLKGTYDHNRVWEVDFF